jgi:single-stranded-DNA-specific exonuclease
LIQELKIGPLLAKLLVARGFSSPESATQFLNPSLDDLRDPYLLPDMGKAVKALMAAKEANEKIFIHGDYDVDGVTSTALLHRFLRKCGWQVESHTPHRTKEGYGIHPSAVPRAKETGARVFLTCDCGIAALSQIDQVNQAGMIAVVTDHHQPKSLLPNAAANVNPHRSDSQYPFPEICGVMVAFKLCLALADELKIDRKNVIRAYLDLVALGTIADMMPLVDENRAVVKFGLPSIQASKKVGIKALLSVAELTGKALNAGQVSFQMAPRLNAVGRLGDSAVALQLLLSEDEDESAKLALDLNTENLKRREHQDEALEQAKEMVLSQGLLEKHSITLAHDKWHVGVVGNIASKVVETFHRPTFIFSILEDGTVKGSGRSIKGLALHEVLDLNASLLLGGGGHEMAAGASLLRENFLQFSQKFDDFARSVLDPSDLVRRLEIDAKVEAADMRDSTWAELTKLEPTGMGNRQPLFALMETRLVQVRALGKSGKHAALDVEKGGAKFTFKAWHKLPELQELVPGTMMDIAFQPGLNEFNGRTSWEYTLKAYRLAEGI